MKYIVLGKNGQLGKELVKILNKKNYVCKSYDIADLDVTDFNKVRNTFFVEKPDVVINATAYNDVDKTESDPNPAFNINALAVNNLADVCNTIDSKFVHFSTDYVFDGKKNDLYNEKDVPIPLSYYGRSKLSGELLLKTKIQDFLIFRLSWVYGEGNQNFIYKFQQWANKNETLRIVTDEISVPTSAKTAAKITIEAIEKEITGLYHLTNTGFTSRYDWALEIKNILNLSNKIIPASISEFDLPAKRPEFSAMDNSHISNKLGITIPEWQYDLNDFLTK